VNSARVDNAKPAIDVTGQDWDTVFDTNLKGCFFLSTAQARTWLESRTPGSVVATPPFRKCQWEDQRDG
jgi:NAD(P)-dependent dehydrogenase (short-subunit alcohol dehydrogenase family)